MRRRAPKALLLSAAALALLAPGGSRPARGQGATQAPAGGVAASPTPSPTPDPKTPLEIQKLQAEIESLKISNEALDASSKWATTWVTALGGVVVTLFVAMVGLYFNFTQSRKLKQDKRLGREEHLLKVFRDLGDDKPRVRIGAVAVLVQRVGELERKRQRAERAHALVRWWWGRRLDAEEKKEVPTVVSVLISVTKHEMSAEIQKYIADGIAEGLDAILDPEKEKMGSRQKHKYEDSPLKKYDFQGAQLQNAWWYSIDARAVDFYGANLNRAGLRLSLLSKAVLKKADLTSAVLEGADLTHANLEGAKLVKANLKGAVLVGAKLKGANLQGADLGGANFAGADVTGVDFSGVKNLNGADLKGAVGYTPPPPPSADTSLPGAAPRNA